MFWADKVKKQKLQLLINLLFLVSSVTHWKAGIKSHSRVWTSQRSQRYCDCVQWSWLGLKVAVRCSLCVIRQWITATKLHNIARVASSQDLVELRFRNSSRNCDVVIAGRQHRCSDPSLSYGSKTSWTESQRRVVDETRSSMLTWLYDLNLNPSLICDPSSCLVIKSGCCNHSQSVTDSKKPPAFPSCTEWVFFYPSVPEPLFIFTRPSYIHGLHHCVCEFSCAQYTLVCLHAAVTDK